MTQPVDPNLIAALNARYAQQQPTTPQQPNLAAPPPSAMQSSEVPTLDDGTVPVVSSAGVVGSVPAAQLTDAQNAGYRVIPREGYEYEQRRIAAGEGFRNQFLATSEGAFRGLTRGLSDQYARRYGREGFADEVALRKEANPYLAGAGEIGAGVLEALVTGGIGAGAAVGRGAAAGMARYGGSSLLGRAAVRMVPGIVEGAVDGALQAAGGAVSEAALANRELTGEQLATAIGVGGLLGGSVGGLLRVPGTARAEVARLVRGGTASEIAEAVSGKLAAAKRAMGDSAGATTEDLIGKLDAVAADQSEALQQFADRMGKRGLGGLIKADREFYNLAKRNPEAAKKAYELYTTGLATKARGAERGFAGATREEMLDAGESLLNDGIKRRAKIIVDVDSAVGKTDISDIVGDLRRVAREEFGEVGQEAGQRELLSYASRLEKKHGKFAADATGAMTLAEPPTASLQSLERTRVTIDNRAKWAQTQKLAPQEQALRRARQIIEEGAEKRIDDASAALSSDQLHAWKQVKTDIAAATTVRDAVKRGVESNANRAWGFSEQVGSITGATIGMALGPLGGIVGGMAAAGANRLVKDRGAQAAAAIAARLARGESIRTVADGVRNAIRAEVSESLGKLPGARWVADRVRSTVGAAADAGGATAAAGGLRTAIDTMRGVGGSVARGAAAAGRTAAAGARAGLWYGERRLGGYIALRDAAHGAQQGDATDTTIARMTGSTHPDLAEALRAQQMRAATALAARMPPDPPRQDIRGARPPMPVPYAAIRDAARAADAIEDPRTVIRGMRDGTIRPSDAALLRDVYPEQYAQIVEDILASTDGRDIPASKRRSISILLDAPVDGHTSPEYLAAMTSSLNAELGAEAAENAANNAQPPRRPVSAPRLGTRAYDVAMGRGQS